MLNPVIRTSDRTWHQISWKKSTLFYTRSADLFCFVALKIWHESKHTSIRCTVQMFTSITQAQNIMDIFLINTGWSRGVLFPHLQSGVHLKEVEVLRGVHQELHCAGWGVLHSLGQRHRLLPHGPTRLGVQKRTVRKGVRSISILCCKYTYICLQRKKTF